MDSILDAVGLILLLRLDENEPKRHQGNKSDELIFGCWIHFYG